MKTFWETDISADEIEAALLKNSPVRLWSLAYHQFRFGKVTSNKLFELPHISLHSRRKGCAVVLHSTAPAMLVFSFVLSWVYAWLFQQLPAGDPVDRWMWIIIMIPLYICLLDYIRKMRALKKTLDEITQSKGCRRHSISAGELERE